MTDKPLVRDFRARLAAQTPAQKIRTAQRAQAMARGEITTPPFRCAHCTGTSLTKELGDPKFPDVDDENVRLCLSCGRRTKVTTLRRQRQLDIRALLLAD